MFMVLLMSDLKAAVFTGIYGQSTRLGNEASLSGMGVDFEFTLPERFWIENLNPYFEVSALTDSQNTGEPLEITYLYCPISLGSVYQYQILNSRFYLNLWIQAGPYFMKKDSPKKYGNYYDFTDTQTVTSWGPQGTMELGVSYIYTQKFSVFARGGYHVGYFDDEIAGESIQKGYTFSAGVKFTLSGTNRSI